MNDAASHDYSWSIPNRRFIDSGLYLPSIRSEGIDTMQAAAILIDQDPGPGDRLDAYLLLAGREFLWRRDGPGADFADAVTRYEAATGRTLPRPAALPSFGAVKWRGAERRHEVGVWLAGRFLGWLSSPTRRPCRTARDWRADERVLVALGLAPRRRARRAGTFPRRRPAPRDRTRPRRAHRAAVPRRRRPHADGRSR